MKWLHVNIFKWLHLNIFKWLHLNNIGYFPPHLLSAEAQLEPIFNINIFWDVSKTAFANAAAYKRDAWDVSEDTL